MSTSLRVHAASRAAPGPGTAAALAGALLAAVAAAAFAGDGLSTRTALLPIAVLGILGLAGLALSRFTWFVIAILVMRSSLDLVRSATGGTSASRMFNPSTVVAVLFLLAAVLWLLAQRRNFDLGGSSLRYALLAFLGAAFLSVVGAGDRINVLVEALRIGAAVTMFVVLELLARDPRKLEAIIAAAFASAILPLMLVAFSLATGNLRTADKGGLSRVTGSFNQPNLFGRYLMLLVIMAVAIYPVVQPHARRFLAGFVAVAGVCILFTYTRSALVGTVIGIVVIGFSGRKRTVLGLIAVAVVAMVAIPSVATRFGELAGGAGNNGRDSNSFEWRLDYWTQVLPLANDRPLTGIGVGQTDVESARGVLPHNDFIRAYVETGIVGFLAYVGMLVGLIAAARRAVANTVPRTFERGVTTGFLACAVALATVSAVANIFSNVVTLWYFFAFAAAATAIDWRHRMTSAGLVRT